MNFDVEKVVEQLGIENIEDLDMLASSIVTTAGVYIMCWYYRVDDTKSVIGFPLRIIVDSEGDIAGMLRYNPMSDDIFFVIPNHTISTIGAMREDHFEHFEDLCDAWIDTISDEITETAGEKPVRDQDEFDLEVFNPPKENIIYH